MELMKDDMMLLSFINMKLRDQYDSLDSLCDDLDISYDEVMSRLTNAGFEYMSNLNQFR